MGSKMALQKADRVYLSTVLRLTLLAPDIVGAILEGRQPPELDVPRLLEAFLVGWAEQHTRPGASVRPEPAADD